MPEPLSKATRDALRETGFVPDTEEETRQLLDTIDYWEDAALTLLNEAHEKGQALADLIGAWQSAKLPHSDVCASYGPDVSCLDPSACTCGLTRLMEAFERIGAQHDTNT